MARQNHGPLSRAKGKLGGVVYQQYEGMQISREYQPVVKNPQTSKQTENRAKFKAASQITALFKEIFMLRLAKLSIYNRTRRGVAVNSLYRIAEIDNDNSAEVNFDEAVSAINAKSLTEYAAPTVTVASNNYQVTAPANAIIFGVIAGFDSDGNFVTRKVVQETSSGSAATFATLNDVASQRAMFAYTIATSEEGRAIYDNIRLGDNDLGVEIERLVASGDMSVSDIAGFRYPTQP